MGDIDDLEAEFEALEHEATVNAEREHALAEQLKRQGQGDPEVRAMVLASYEAQRESLIHTGNMWTASVVASSAFMLLGIGMGVALMSTLIICASALMSGFSLARLVRNGKSLKKLEARFDAFDESFGKDDNP